jgi:hypothetical protein
MAIETHGTHIGGSETLNCGLFPLFGSFNCHSSEASPKLLCLSIHEDQSPIHPNLIKIFVALACDRIPRYVQHVKSVFFLVA